MKALILALLPFTVSAAPISEADWNAAQRVSDNIVIQTCHDVNTGEQSLCVKFQRQQTVWSPSLGLHTAVMDYCAITYVSEFMAVTGERKAGTALMTPTERGWLRYWNHDLPAPNVPAQCLQP